MTDNLKERIESAVADQKKAERVNWNKLDMPIEYQGKAITLPGDPAKMPIRAAIEALSRKLADEETEVIVYEIIDGYPLDAAVAFVKAMTKLYGWASPAVEVVQGMMGPQERPPVYRPVKVGKNKEDVIQVPLGAFRLPGVSNMIKTVIDHTDKGLCFIIHAKVKQKEKAILIELATETRRIVEEESIYRGKAIRIRVDDNGELDINNPPEFLDTDSVGEEDVLFSQTIRDQIRDNILVPIKFPEACRKNKVPKKRTVLLEGPYGTGKSLTAAMVARVCEENDVTFVLLDRVQGLKAGLEFAKRFGRAVFFAEDIDRVAMDRDERMNDLINTIDGVVSKSSQIMTILTTNHADQLHPVILRPGRLDAVISLRAPDATTVRKLIAHYAGKLVPEGESLEKAGKALEGQIPASIRECVERAKLGMIGRGANKLSDHDLFIAAETMKNHLALLNKDQKVKTTAETLAESLQKVVRGEDDDVDLTVKQQVAELYDHIIN